MSATIWQYQVRDKKAEGESLIDNSTSLRPTRNRLLTAMGISACSVAVLLAFLGSFVDFSPSTSKHSIEHVERLTIYVRKGEPSSDFTTGNRAVRLSSREEIVATDFTELQQEVASVDPPESPADSQPKINWRAIAVEAARASVDERFRQEESRASMWRQSHSIMFQPAGDFVVKKEKPIISNFQFKPRVYVVGLGLNIGSCFIGIPLVGVPVEQRTVAISLFVCA